MARRMQSRAMVAAFRCCKQSRTHLLREVYSDERGRQRIRLNNFHRCGAVDAEDDAAKRLLKRNASVRGIDFDDGG